MTVCPCSVMNTFRQNIHFHSGYCKQEMSIGTLITNQCRNNVENSGICTFVIEKLSNFIFLTFSENVRVTSELSNILYLLIQITNYLYRLIGVNGITPGLTPSHLVCLSPAKTWVSIDIRQLSTFFFSP